ncbi:DUF5658 family protein [Natronomonas moolapensis]|uniref:DUF5658 family protein n=1 Tax=Natronomonas moolapensis TaxID=416273 RepID=UPI0012603492|nr:DUF5658 family protein [Natronomonas moolapensis]
MEREAVASTGRATSSNIEALTGLKYPLVIGLVVVRAVDASLTYYGLSIGLREANPIVVAVIETIGIIPGLLCLSSVSVLLVLFVGEYLLPGVTQPRYSTKLCCSVGYISLLMLWSAVSLHNVVVLWT